MWELKKKLCFHLKFLNSSLILQFFFNNFWSIFFNRIFIAHYYTNAGVIKKKLQSCYDLSNIINEIKQESLENNYFFFLYISYIYSFSIILLTIFEENILGISFQCGSQMTKINQSNRCQLINNLRINK